MVESSDETRSTREGNSKPLNYSCFENPMISMKRQIVLTLKEELPRLVGAHIQLEKNGESTPERKREGAKAKTVPSCGCDL